MRTIKKRHLAALIIAMATMGAGIGINYAAAADDSDKASPISELVEAIADKFDLDKNEVQAVFDEHHEKMQAQREEQMAQVKDKMEQEFADRLKEAVENGDLTQKQADLIADKRTELEESRQIIHNKLENPGKMTDEERKARQEEMKSQRDDLKSWAKSNDIPEKYLFMMGGPGGFGMHGKAGAASVE